ncbi:MAG: tetratricopeptide repeat protein [Betaproteobacteria bacterium]|nr:tetratricopeptide repeat protein [Betaproteobacteria bacterium]
MKRVLRAEPSPARAAGPEGPEEWLRAGYECECRGDPAGADRLYRRVLESDPAHTDALYFLGRMAVRDRRQQEAIALFQQAVDLRPGEALYQLELGAALLDARRFEEAIEVYRVCLGLQPDCTRLRNNYAVALIELNRRPEALPELERLQALLPNVPEVHFNLAGIYREFGRTDEAIATYRRALALVPDHAPTHSNLLLELNYSCNEDAAAIFAEHQRFGARFARRYEAPAPDPAWPRRLRLGYLSPDFREHVVMRFMEPILARHDRGRFEVTCYHTNPRRDAVTGRLRALAEHWVDADDLSERELAERIRADRIDILVDLAGHTAGNSMPVLAMKPASLQATYLGYPNTTGLGAVDYRITDAWADPPGEADRYTAERLVRLPRSYFCYRPEPDSPAVASLPALSKGTVTFGCFNNFAKLSAPFLDAAARTLAQVPGSRLILKGRPLSVESVADSVRGRFRHAGIDPARVELRGWEAGVKDHLAIYNSVDIALDSFPYNGATTTCEALWMGVPVVSLAGDRHAARMGASLLHAMGLEQYLTHEVDAYIATSVRLAGNIEHLAELRRGLRERMRSSPLLDEQGFARVLERCYLELWETRKRSEAVPGATGEESDNELIGQARRLRAAGRLAEARARCEKILAGTPAHPDALTLQWDLAFDGDAPGAAIDWINRAIAADPRVAAFHYMLGCALQAVGRTEDAIASFRRALELDDSQAKTHNNLGCALEAAGNLAAAVDCYRGAIGRDPAMAQALYNLGNVYGQLGDTKQAIDYVSRALAIETRHADWRCNLGSLRYRELQLDEAIADFRAAIEIAPGYERAHADLGGALLVAGRVEEARAAWAKALELDPGLADVESRSLLALHFREGEDAQLLLDRHVSWRDRHARGLLRATAHRLRDTGPGRRLNIGYVSPDFARRPLAAFIEPVLAAHDRAAFQVFCYATGGQEDEVTRRLRGMCAHWRDISRFANEQAADQVRADGIDILVDLAGHAAGGRLLLFARRPAPVQATWLGYPDTTGLDAIDYRLTDPVADPRGESERFHAEKLLRLPASFLCYQPEPDCLEAGEVPQSRSGHVTFGSFNELAAMTPHMIALWAQILLAQPQARLVLGSYGLSAASARRDMGAQLLAHGIAEQRFDLHVPDFSPAGRLAAYREIDIALDVFPYAGMSATCEALWMGVPVVTLAGRTCASRTGASILSSIGLAELVATTPEQYAAIVLRLAGQLDERRALRAGMRERMRASPLLDAARFTRALEDAYREMGEKRLRAPA